MDRFINYWNQRINVISRKDIENLYLHHVLHSLSIARIIQFQSGIRLLLMPAPAEDFPVFRWPFFFPDVHFILVDSIAKKIRVVETIIQEIGLAELLKSGTCGLKI